MVTETTKEVYEELTPHLVQLINQTHRNTNLTEAQKQDEISIHMMGYVKSCTNEIIIEGAGRDPGGWRMKTRNNRMAVTIKNYRRFYIAGSFLEHEEKKLFDCNQLRLFFFRAALLLESAGSGLRP